MQTALPVHRPPVLRIEWGTDGPLRTVARGEIRPVWVVRCFPWSNPSRYISLRDGDDSEVALIREPAELDPDSREALEAALIEAGFVFDVVRVTDLTEEIEIRHWTVETRQGVRAFQTRLDEWPRRLPSGGLLIRDVAGDLYHVANPERLDRRSREWLWAFVD